MQRVEETRFSPTAEGSNQLVALRQQAVQALDDQRRLEGRRREAVLAAARLEEMAVEALGQDRGSLLAILDRRVEVLKQAESLVQELEEATARASRLKQALRYQRW